MEQENAWSQQYDFDYFVIGGGSGGLASAKAAKKAGAKKVGLCDFVRKSPQGTSWGIGGTCVNVGCIPKKLMHFASLMGEQRKDQEECGFSVDWDTKHSWTKMQSNVANHIKNLNWGYEVQLGELGIEVFNAQGTFLDEHTVQLTDEYGGVVTKTAGKFCVAVGGRPRLANNIKGGELCNTSDDLFWMTKSPGKTLVVGAGYVALECAGFLQGIGLDVTVAVRSRLLRGFDEDMTDRIGKYMEKQGTKFVKGVVLGSLEKKGEQILVNFNDKEGKDTGKPEVYDTVLLAIGRDMETGYLNLDKAGVKTDKWGKILINKEEQTSTEHIYAIGDNAVGVPELTPVAIKSGILLSNRLFGDSKKLMDYTNICTTVFTPIEFSTVGLSETDAIEKFGEDCVEVFHTQFKPLEWNFLKSHEDDGYVKVIVNLKDDKVLGIHFLGPNAGEVIMGFATCMKMGVTREVLFDTVGLHPTCAEEIVLLTVTKRQDKDAKKDGC